MVALPSGLLSVLVELFSIRLVWECPGEAEDISAASSDLVRRRLGGATEALESLEDGEGACGPDRDRYVKDDLY